jgi:anti-sigma factor RsiW
MNKPCPQMQDRIADYVLGALDARQTQTLQEHLAGCEACREYARSLEVQANSLVALGREIETGMSARQDRVIEALQNAAPVTAGAGKAFPFIGGFVRTAVAAALVLGAGVVLGRWTAPRPVDVEQLRAEVQASVAAALQPAVQEAVLAQVDQRLSAGWATAEANLRAELGNQLRGDLQLFAAQFTAGSEKQMEKRFTELVQLIEDARLKDRQYVARALDRIEQNQIRDKRQIGLGLQSIVALTAKATPAVQH